MNLNLCKYFFIGLSVLLFSCNSKQKDKSLKRVDTHYLKQAETKLFFPLDEKTKCNPITFFTFNDSTGKQYLTFQNLGTNEILFYDIDSSKYLFRVVPEIEGPDGVGMFLGYSVYDWDNIYLTIPGKSEIVCIDRNAKIKDRISYEKTTDGYDLFAYTAISFTYKPIIRVEDELFIISECNRMSKNNVVSANINLKTKEIHAYPFQYPRFPCFKDKSKAYSIETEFSRCYRNRQFIYSFFYDENIHVVSIDNGSVQALPVKSKYIGDIEMPDENVGFSYLMKSLCEKPTYGNLYYDPYREVYYRIAYPPTEIDRNENVEQIWRYGRKLFSIIILDKNFRIIGETLTPEYTYNSKILFINEDGLYICENHYKNPEFNEDIMSFQCFKLVKK
jgi:hypothetical protein